VVRDAPDTVLEIVIATGIWPAKLLMEPLLAISIADFTEPPAPIEACTVLGAVVGAAACAARPATAEPGISMNVAAGTNKPVNTTLARRRMDLGALMVLSLSWRAKPEREMADIGSG